MRELRIPLTPGVWPFLRLSLDDKRTAPIAVTHAELELAAANIPTDSVPVKIEERSEVDGKTTFRLKFPYLHMNLSELILETPDPFFQRKASLSELRYLNGEVSPVSLGEDQFYRLPQAGKMALTFSGPLLASATLVIENGDNAPLSISAVRAAYRRAFLVSYFERAGTYRLVSGNPLAAPARYDLASLGAELKKARVIFPKVRSLEVNAAFAASNEFQDIPALGSALKTKAWSYRKSVTSKPGVAEILLDEECLSHAEKSLADLRLVSSNRQIPFLLVRHSGTKKIVLPIQTAADAKRPSLSRWELNLPRRGLPISRLSLQVHETKNPYFERQIRLFEKRLDARESIREWTLVASFWKRSPGQKAAPLNLALSEPPETEKLLVETDNGDNQPLELVSASASYEVSSIVFRSEGRETFLYYGNDDASTPRYDLELASLRLLQAEKVRPTLGPEETLKAEHAGIRLGGKSGWIFWAALVVVVAGLLFVLARLLPKPS
ncbi:MAG: hypothetical protein JNM63_02545 [Spirochaetia bacterium]|nr:hypothetical protein [Spirochaetia bacterium]